MRAPDPERRRGRDDAAAAPGGRTAPCLPMRPGMRGHIGTAVNRAVPGAGDGLDTILYG